jgi:hypothetical protein
MPNHFDLPGRRRRRFRCGGKQTRAREVVPAMPLSTAHADVVDSYAPTLKFKPPSKPISISKLA